jgi:hypothetical protein
MVSLRARLIVNGGSKVGVACHSITRLKTSDKKENVFYYSNKLLNCYLSDKMVPFSPLGYTPSLQA